MTKVDVFSPWSLGNRDDGLMLGTNRRQERRKVLTFGGLNRHLLSKGSRILNSKLPNGMRSTSPNFETLPSLLSPANPGHPLAHRPQITKLLAAKDSKQQGFWDLCSELLAFEIPKGFCESPNLEDRLDSPKVGPLHRL